MLLKVHLTFIFTVIKMIIDILYVLRKSCVHVGKFLNSIFCIKPIRHLTH